MLRLLIILKLVKSKSNVFSPFVQSLRRSKWSYRALRQPYGMPGQPWRDKQPCQVNYNPHNPPSLIQFIGITRFYGVHYAAILRIWFHNSFHVDPLSYLVNIIILPKKYCCCLYCMFKLRDREPIMKQEAAILLASNKGCFTFKQYIFLWIDPKNGCYCVDSKYTKH